MKKIRIYENLEHQQKVEIEESLKLTPAERIAQVVAMTKKIYPIKKSGMPKKIKFHNEYFS